MEAADHSNRTVLPGSSPGGVRDLKLIRERLATIAKRLLWDGEENYCYPAQDMREDVAFMLGVIGSRLRGKR